MRPFTRGTAVLIIDPAWARSGARGLSRSSGMRPVITSVAIPCPVFRVARRKKSWRLTAFAGASIKRFEVYHGRAFFAEAIRAATRLYSGGRSSRSPTASRPHRGRYSRLQFGIALRQSCSRNTRVQPLNPLSKPSTLRGPQHPPGSRTTRAFMNFFGRATGDQAAAIGRMLGVPVLLRQHCQHADDGAVRRRTSAEGAA